MTPRPTLPSSAQLHDYVLAHSTRPDDVQQEIIDETAAAFPDATSMQLAPDQGAVLTLVTRMLGARSAVEIGTFTGFSALCIAKGLSAGGTLLTCDINEEWTRMAQRHWVRAGVADRIDLRLGPALETVRALPPDPVVDLAFIDADKSSYIAYWDELVPRLRRGGALLVDNTLWSGRVLQDPSEQDDRTAAIVAFNDHAAVDPRVELVILTIGDGLTMALKR